MQLRFTKGVGVALAIAAVCTVLGFAMAPGWWAFAAFSAWWGFVLAARDTAVNDEYFPDQSIAEREQAEDWYSPSRSDLAVNIHYRGLSNSSHDL